MNIALVLQHKWMQGLQRLLVGAAPQPAQQRSLQPAIAHALPACQPAPSPAKPLRVLRVVDKDQPRSCSGRMVISGRMADVCAELDRLAAREAALH